MTPAALQRDRGRKKNYVALIIGQKGNYVKLVNRHPRPARRNGLRRRGTLKKLGYSTVQSFCEALIRQEVSRNGV